MVVQAQNKQSAMKEMKIIKMSSWKTQSKVLRFEAKHLMDKELWEIAYYFPTDSRMCIYHNVVVEIS